jgi:hypothetical protein
MGTTLRSGTRLVPPDSGGPPVPTPSLPTTPRPDHMTGPVTTVADTRPQQGPKHLPTPSRATGHHAETLGAGASPRLGQAGGPHAGPVVPAGAQDRQWCGKRPTRAPGYGLAHRALAPHRTARPQSPCAPWGPCGGHRRGARHTANETPPASGRRAPTRPPSGGLRPPGGVEYPAIACLPRVAGGPPGGVPPDFRTAGQAVWGVPQTYGVSGTPGMAIPRQQAAPPRPPRCRLAMEQASEAGSLACAEEEGVSAPPTGSLESSSPGAAPNAGRQARPKAGAQRTLEGVAWTPWLGAGEAGTRFSPACATAIPSTPSSAPGGSASPCPGQ